MGFDGTVTRAAGQGIAYVRSPDHDKLEERFFVYIPSVDGTIISLEHHTRTHPTIHTWTQEATLTSDTTGWVTFRDENDAVVSRYQTKQEKGLYSIQDLDFYRTQPATIATCQKAAEDDMSISDTPTIKMQTNLQHHPTNSIDFDQDLAAMNIQDQLQPVIEWTEPRCTFVIYKVQTQQVAQHTEKDILNFETWHRRLAHYSEKRLR